MLLEENRTRQQEGLQNLQHYIPVLLQAISRAERRAA
jgi:hypothetical protein